MITSDNALLFSYALWLIGRRDFGLDLPALRSVIGRWFFMAHTTGWYTNSPETQFESDLGRIADLPAGDGVAFIAELDRLVAANFTGDYWEISLPNRLDTSSPRSPVLFAYLAALNLLDAEVLFSDIRVKDLLDPGVSSPRSIERHHLFPKKHLATIGVTGTKQVNAIANMAFLDWPENAKISDTNPLHYWPLMIEGQDPGRLKRQEYLHALPVGWEQLDYATFLERRRVLIARVVRDGFAMLWADRRHDRPTTVEDLIEAGESQTIEFKSTARWNVHTRQHDPKIESVIVKAVWVPERGGRLLAGRCARRRQHHRPCRGLCDAGQQAERGWVRAVPPPAARFAPVGEYGIDGPHQVPRGSGCAGLPGIGGRLRKASLRKARQGRLRRIRRSPRVDRAWRQERWFRCGIGARAGNGTRPSMRTSTTPPADSTAR